MPERSYAAVLFDMDGVLIDSVTMYERHWRLWADRRGIDREAAIAVHHGHSAAETISLVAPHLDAFEQAADYNGALAEDPAVDGIRLLPGARAATASLPTDRWAVATSAARAIAERCLSGVDLRPGALVAIEDVARGKPAPDPYIAAAMRLGADPADCLVIEDAPPGIAAGRAAGCDVIGLTTTHAPSNLMAASALLADLRDLRITLADDHRTLWIDWPDP